MMRKQKFFAVLMALSVSSLLAQNYKIQDFIPDSVTTWQLYGRGSLSSEIMNRDKEGKEDYQEYKDIEFQPDILYNFQKIRSDYKLNYKIRTSVMIHQAENESYQSDANRDRNEFYFSADFNNVKYYKKQIGLIGDINFNYLANNQITKETRKDTLRIIKLKSDTENRNLNISFQPGISYGRIYSGWYSAKAMEIVDEIRKSGHLKRELSREEYLTLSQIILNRKSVYHYDSRIKKIEALEEILTYLQSIKALPEDNVTPAIIVSDIYDYNLRGDKLQRAFGTVTYLKGIVGRQSIDSESVNKQKYYSVSGDFLMPPYSQKHVNENSIKVYGISTGLDYGKIINWNLFYDVSFNLQYLWQEDNRESQNYENTEYERKLKDFSTDLMTNVYYQFDSRSFIKVTGGLHFASQILDKGTPVQSNYTKKQEDYTLYFDPHFIYFITPKFTLDASLPVEWYKWWEHNINDGNASFDSSEETRFNFSLRLDYYL